LLKKTGDDVQLFMKAVKSYSTSSFLTSEIGEVSSQQNICFDSFARAVASFNVVLM